MKHNIITAMCYFITLTAASVHARETVITTELSSGFDFSDRTYDETSITGEGISPPEIGISEEVDQSLLEEGVIDGNITRDDDRADFVIRPSMSIFSESLNDEAMFKYTPSLLFDTTSGDSGDVNHEASASYKRSLSRDWQIKISDIFKNTDEFNTIRQSEDGVQSGESDMGTSFGTSEESSCENFIDKMVTAFPESNDTLRDDSGRRRYSGNMFDISSAYRLAKDSCASLGYGWNILRYDDAEEDYDDSYQDYDKHNVSVLLSHRFDQQWKVTGYGRYIRGLYDTDYTGVDDDLTEYNFGGMLSSDFVPFHPLTLSYDFAETDYDSDSVDSSHIHKVNLGYLFAASPLWSVSGGIGPTYTKLTDSDDSWDTNGYLRISYRVERASLSLNSSVGTRFDNFSGTDERGLAKYWETRFDIRYPLLDNLSTSAYFSYLDENRDEVLTDTEIDVYQYAAGAAISYNINDHYDVGINYGYVIQDSDRSADNYDEHRLLLNFSYKTDLFTW